MNYKDEQMNNGNREYKSDVFSMLMEDKRYALDVFNCLNGTEYTDTEQLEIVTLERGISLSIRNDASFIIDNQINFYEHQSTYNPNMPLRSLIYYATELGRELKNLGVDIFRRKQIEIPTPRFVVFYNGEEKRPEVELMRLSDAYIHKIDEPELELVCKVININIQNNQELLKHSRVLQGYSFFVEQVRANRKANMQLKDALDVAIEECIRRHVLEEFFRERKEEVKKVMHLDYTWEVREELIRKESLEEGEARGEAKGRIDSVDNIRENLGLELEAACAAVGISLEEYAQMKKELTNE